MQHQPAPQQRGGGGRRRGCGSGCSGAEAGREPLLALLPRPEVGGLGEVVVWLENRTRVTWQRRVLAQVQFGREGLEGTGGQAGS